MYIHKKPVFRKKPKNGFVSEGKSYFFTLNDVRKYMLFPYISKNKLPN